MKIYCIKIDTMPFCSEVLEIARMMNGILLRQVSGCFTTTAVIPMFTGKLTSDLEPHGIGYTTWKTNRDKKGFARFSWAKEYIQFYLLNKDFKFVNRNLGDFLDSLGLPVCPFFTDNHTSPYDQHDGNSWKYLTTRGPEWANSRKDEFTWIDKAQVSSNENLFYFINYSHYHAAVSSIINKQKQKQKIAGQNILELMNHYDFSEPNSLFWIFSDHGAWEQPHLDKYPYPEHFYSWAIVRDNTKNSISFPSKVISVQDFSSFIKLKFNDTPISIPSSKERIFFTEDGRSKYGDKKLITALACRFKKWEGKFPLQMSYVIWNELDNKFIQRVTEFDETGFVKKHETLSKVVDRNLMDALIQRFTWVKEK